MHAKVNQLRTTTVYTISFLLVRESKMPELDALYTQRIPLLLLQLLLLLLLFT
jgi:hypothetical protein